ncbi:hypothetical protein Baya_9893 [Bagarius yarrelli]|uniref:Uncharacterized protein n=1 Tax=Bagarius yarrelli TaxID=175774 RepID=A0A556U8Z0_BAGYA|nr:hypothetical protein Baya_9893 [Bagarius yarrelli]
MQFEASGTDESSKQVDFQLSPEQHFLNPKLQLRGEPRPKSTVSGSFCHRGADKARVVDVIKEDLRTRLTFEIHLAENPTSSLLLYSQGNKEAIKSLHPSTTLKSCPCFQPAQSRIAPITHYPVTLFISAYQQGSELSKLRSLGAASSL